MFMIGISQFQISQYRFVGIIVRAAVQESVLSKFKLLLNIHFQFHSLKTVIFSLKNMF